MSYRNVGWWRWHARHGRSFSRWRWHAARRRFIPWSHHTLISRFLVLIRSARIFIIRTDKCEVLVGLLRSRRSLTCCNRVVLRRGRRRSYWRRRAGRPSAFGGALDQLEHLLLLRLLSFKFFLFPRRPPARRRLAVAIRASRWSLPRRSAGRRSVGRRLSFKGLVRGRFRSHQLFLHRRLDALLLDLRGCGLLELELLPFISFLWRCHILVLRRRLVDRFRLRLLHNHRLY